MSSLSRQQHSCFLNSKSIYDNAIRDGVSWEVLIEPKISYCQASILKVTEENSRMLLRHKWKIWYRESDDEMKAKRADGRKAFKAGLSKVEQDRRKKTMAETRRERDENNRVKKMFKEFLAREHGIDRPRKKAFLFGQSCSVWNIPPQVKQVLNGVNQSDQKCNGVCKSINGQAKPKLMEDVVMLFVVHCGLESEDVIFDCGAGSGDSIIRLAALSKCFFLGIEFDKTLYTSSMRILKTITTNARDAGNDPQITGMFFHGDIVSLHFLGLTFLVAEHSHSHPCPVNTNNLFFLDSSISSAHSHQALLSTCLMLAWMLIW